MARIEHGEAATGADDRAAASNFGVLCAELGPEALGIFWLAERAQLQTPWTCGWLSGLSLGFFGGRDWGCWRGG